MPHATLKLIPGVDTTKTPTLNEMAVSRSNLVRLVPDRSGLGLIQKLGGWTSFISNGLTNTVRALKAWSDLEYTNYLAIGGEGDVGVKVYDSSSGSVFDVTPFYISRDEESSFANTGIALQEVQTHTDVRVATTANLTATYNNGAGTLTNSSTQAAISIDGVSLSVGNRVLVKNQTSGFQNGVYQVTTVGSSSVNWVLTRVADFNAWASGNIYTGATFYVTLGTTNANKYFYCTNTNTPPFVLGSTAIAFVIGGGFTTNSGTDSITFYAPVTPSSASYVYFPTIINVGNINLLGPYDILTTGAGFVTFQIPGLTTSIAKIKSATSGGNRIVTVTFNQVHSFYGGQDIYVAGVADATFNGSFTISSTPGDVTPYTIKYTQTGVTTATNSGGGTVNARVNFGGVPPEFTNSAVGSSTIQVTLVNHGFSVGDTLNITKSTTVGGVTLSGLYTVNKVSSASPNNFSSVFEISADRPATSVQTKYENNGDIYTYYFVSLVTSNQSPNYYYNGGIYNEGLYSSGYVPSANNGQAITSENWTFDNWGSILVACPINGAVYYWQPTGGSANNLSYMPNAPVYNTGVFVAMPQRQIIAYGSSFGSIQDPLLIRWCDLEDFTTWIAQANNQAGSYRIPTGSKIVGGIQASQQALIWTDLDLWSMTYIGQPYIYGFNKIGANAGLISQKAAGIMGGVAYWMGQKQFFKFAGSGVEVIPCPVWDQVFQNLYAGTDENGNPYIDRIRCATNSQYNEVTWYFPAQYLGVFSPEDDAELTSARTGNGEVNAYVKYNVALNQWDYGYQDPDNSNVLVARTAWIDQSVLGPPIGSATTKSVDISNGVAIEGYFTGTSIYAAGSSGVQTIYFNPTTERFAVGSSVGTTSFTNTLFNGTFTVTSSTVGNSSAVSIPAATPAVVTWANHGLSANNVIYFTTTQTMPTGMSANTVYFVKTVLSQNTFTFSATIGGAAIATSSAAVGVLKCYRPSSVSMANASFTSLVTDTSSGLINYQVSSPVYQHETSNNANGYAMTSGFTTGYASLSEGDKMTFIDQVWPDMKWGQFDQSKLSEVNITFYVTNYPGDTPTVYGPYSVNHDTQYLSVRMRGRLVAIGVSSTGSDSFWRLGGIRYRFQEDGKY